MSLYNSSGQINLTPVTGSSYTGLYSATGSWNIVFTPNNTTYHGIYHPCGALWATENPSATTYYATDGSINVMETPSGYVPVFPVGPITIIFYRADTTLVTADNTNLTADYAH